MRRQRARPSGRAEDPRKGAGAEATAGEAEGIGSGHGSSTPRPCKPARPPSERTGSAAARGESPLAEAVAVGGSGTPHIPCTVLDDEEGATPGCCSKVEGGIDDDVGEGPCTILEDDPGDEERSEGADTTIPAIWRSQGAGLQPSQKGHGELLAAQAQRAQLGNQPTKNNFPCKVGEPTFHARLHNKSSHHEETGEALQASGTSYRGGASEPSEKKQEETLPRPIAPPGNHPRAPLVVTSRRAPSPLGQSLVKEARRTGGRRRARRKADRQRGGGVWGNRPGSSGSGSGSKAGSR